MKTFLATGMIVLVALAGCASQTESPDAGEEAPAALPATPSLDAGALLADLQSFADSYGERAGNTPAHEGARDHIEDRFAAAGLEVWRQGFENGIEQENIVGIHWGQTRDQWVVVGAHYDVASKECGLVGQCVLRPYTDGAYDDGSGTMQVLHLAKAFAQVDTTYTIAFVAFDGEERGLQGSHAFFEEVWGGTSPYGNVTLRAMVNLDMFGINWPGTQAPIYFDVNSPELQAAAEEARKDLEIPDDKLQYRGISLGRSDYKWFMEAGIPTGFFISSFEEWDLPADVPYTVEAQNGQTAYPFWHLEDTYTTMELMAGGADDLEAGFQVAVDLATHVLYRAAVDPAPLTGEAR